MLMNLNGRLAGDNQNFLSACIASYKHILQYKELDMKNVAMYIIKKIQPYSKYMSAKIARSLYKYQGMDG